MIDQPEVMMGLGPLALGAIKLGSYFFTKKALERDANAQQKKWDAGHFSRLVSSAKQAGIHPLEAIRSGGAGFGGQSAGGRLAAMSPYTATGVLDMVDAIKTDADDDKEQQRLDNELQRREVEKTTVNPDLKAVERTKVDSTLREIERDGTVEIATPRITTDSLVPRGAPRDVAPETFNPDTSEMRPFDDSVEQTDATTKTTQWSAVPTPGVDPKYWIKVPADDLDIDNVIVGLGVLGLGHVNQAAQNTYSWLRGLARGERSAETHLKRILENHRDKQVPWVAAYGPEPRAWDNWDAEKRLRYLAQAAELPRNVPGSTNPRNPRIGTR